MVSAVAGAPDAVLRADDDEAHDLWGLMLEAARLDEVAEQAVRTLELSVLAKYAFGLAQAFNGFYHKYSILNEERPDVRVWRAAAVIVLSRATDKSARADGVRGAGEDVNETDRRSRASGSRSSLDRVKSTSSDNVPRSSA